MPVELIAYETRHPDDWTIEPASKRRDWMEQTVNKTATRCLPLTIANHAGWIVRCPVRFKVTWRGEHDPKSTTFEFPDQEKLYAPQITRNFGSGIVTFSLPWLFRTSEPYGLIVRGPTNFWIENASPLDGLVETNWAPYTFTMNWKIIKPRTPVWFRKGDPICMIMPYPLNVLDQVQPRFESLEMNPQLRSEFAMWVQTRLAQNMRTARTGNQTFALDYTRGQDTFGDAEDRHRSAYKIEAFQGTPGAFTPPPL